MCAMVGIFDTDANRPKDCTLLERSPGNFVDRSQSMPHAVLSPVLNDTGLFSNGFLKANGR